MSSKFDAPTTDTSQESTVASLKRKVASLEAENDLIKRQQIPVRSKNQVNTGRALRRVVDLFATPREMVQESDRRFELMDDVDAPEFTAEENMLHRSYLKLMEQVPLLRHLLEQGENANIQTLYHNVSPLIPLYAMDSLSNFQLRVGSDQARGDDTAKLKAATVPWVNATFGASTPPPSPQTKHERGLDNDHTGRLLCPGEFSWDDLTVRSLIREGHEDFLVTAQSWPNFMYAGYSCDVSDIENGLMKSVMLVKAFKYLFTSPSSAADKSLDTGERRAKRAKLTQPATRSNVACLIGLRAVTPRAIAYVAVQLRFALSSGTSWKLVDIDFSHVEFYAAIVDFFENPARPRSKAKADALLAWWNLQIFGCRNGASEELQRSQPRAGSSMARLAAQRQALENA
ncbi:hypothetical protein HWV62_24346 [Athelia sp. TMB]|nr:hypothetical protein HWV62_24346 [Athelia sp. TMB]